ncbi:MAG TPA: acyltransferase family protein [Mycobacteriales bacterium]|nr:acyltransferase family protein [Mycobacteriales bacterium]
MSSVATANPAARLRYIPALDGMRGLSLPGTILTHYALFLRFNASAPHWLGGVGPLTLNIQMFFVLSGALITSLLVAEHQRTGAVSLKSFYLRRSRRLGPALLATVVVIGVLQVFWSGDRAGSPLANHPAVALGAVTIFLGNWVLFAVNGGLGWLGPAWTLGIEEQFYLTWPSLLVLALRRRMRRGALYACFAVVLAGGLIGATMIESHVGKWRAFYATPVQLPSILFGCVLGYELTANPTGRVAQLVRSRLVALAGFAGMVATSIYLVHNPAPLYKGGYAVYATFACMLIGHCFVRAAEPTLITKVLGWKPFVVVGQMSYEAYLIHTIVILGMLRAFPTVHVYPMMALDTIIVAGISAVFYYLVESPIRKRGWKAAFAGRANRKPALGTAFTAPARRLAIAGSMAGVLAIVGVGIVAARTASPGEAPTKPVIAAEEPGDGNLGAPAEVSRGLNRKGAQNVADPVSGRGGATGVGTNTGGTVAGGTLGGGTTVAGAHPLLAAPTITALAPPTGPIAGGATMTIHGTHFLRHAKVFFNNLQAQQVTRVSSTELRIVTPSAHMVSVRTAFAQLHGLQVAVRVVTKAGTSTAGIASRYTYL